MINPIDFIYDNWREGTIGLAMLAVVVIAAVVIGIAKQIDEQTRK